MMKKNWKLAKMVSLDIFPKEKSALKLTRKSAIKRISYIPSKNDNT